MGQSLSVGGGIVGAGGCIYAIAFISHMVNTLPVIDLLVVVQLCLLQEISCGEESWLVWFVLFFIL